MRQESLGLKEQLPNEITSKLENCAFTNAMFYFSNATISTFDYGLMGSI
jgi:hypothetical protein